MFVFGVFKLFSRIEAGGKPALHALMQKKIFRDDVCCDECVLLEYCCIRFMSAVTVKDMDVTSSLCLYFVWKRLFFNINR